jgi:hypothetical protein
VPRISSLSNPLEVKKKKKKKKESQVKWIKEV